MLSGGNFGINESAPDVKLHVSRPLADPFSALDLIEGTGIMVLGPMTDNVVFDYRGLQARHGEFIGDVLNITATTLNLQRLGGDILIHGDATFDDVIKGIITADGWLGLGILEPVERIDIDGAIKIGNTDNELDNNGTIRFTGTDFEGRKGDAWVSLTGGGGGGGGPWTIGLLDGIYYATGSAPRVAIGDTKNVNTLDVTQKEDVFQGSIAIEVINKSKSLSGGPDDDRVGVQVDLVDLWGGDTTSKCIGFYLREVSGQPNKENNLAAVLNGNVLIGNTVGGSTIIGTGGQHVLALQPTASPPTAIPDTPAIQIYAGENTFGHSALNIMTAGGDRLSLYTETALEPAADMTGFPDSFDPTIVIPILDNMRDRINALEAKLQAFGLLAI
jgi:hypothetical protein